MSNILSNSKKKMIENLNTNYILIAVCAVLALLFIMYIWTTGTTSNSARDNSQDFTLDDDMRHVEPSSTETEVCEGGVCRMPNEIEKQNSMTRANMPYIQDENDAINRSQLPQTGDMPVLP